MSDLKHRNMLNRSCTVCVYLCATFHLFYSAHYHLYLTYFPKLVCYNLNTGKLELLYVVEICISKQKQQL